MTLAATVGLQSQRIRQIERQVGQVADLASLDKDVLDRQVQHDCVLAWNLLCQAREHLENARKLLAAEGL